MLTVTALAALVSIVAAQGDYCTCKAVREDSWAASCDICPGQFCDPFFCGNGSVTIHGCAWECPLSIEFEFAKQRRVCSSEQNPCDGMKAASVLNYVMGDVALNAMKGKLANLPCFEDEADVTAFAPQAGADVTPGVVVGVIDSSGMPAIQGDLKDTSREYPLCAVNVHWHEGAEHRSAGEYDEAGEGPNLGYEGYHGPGDESYGRRLAGGGGQTQGHHCHHYKTFTPLQKQEGRQC